MFQQTANNLRRFEAFAPRLGQRVMIDPSSVLVGDITMGDDCSVWPQVSIRGDVHRIAIGARTNVQDGAVLHVTHAGGPHVPEGHPLVIGDDVTVGHRAILHGCVVGHRVMVGMGAVVMDGAVVEDDVLIAANTLVPPGKRLASGYLYKGTAQQARALTPAEIAGLRYNAAHYVRLKERYLQSGSQSGSESDAQPDKA